MNRCEILLHFKGVLLRDIHKINIHYLFILYWGR